jgi:predicted porin
MPLYTQDEIKTEIIALKTKIAKAETAQSYGAGAGMTLARGDLAAMYRRLEKLEADWAKQESINNQGNVSLVEFEDPS